MPARPGRPPPAAGPRALSSWIASPMVGSRPISRCSLAPGAGLDRGGAQRGGAALGEDDAVDAGRLGRAQERAEVRRVLEVLEDEHERVALGRGARAPASRRGLPSGAPRPRAARPGARRSRRGRVSWSAGTRSTGRWMRRAASVMARSSGDGFALRDQQAMRLAPGGERLGDRPAAADPLGHPDRSTVATAQAAIPSSPAKPRPSEVVPLTDTASGPSPSSPAGARPSPRGAARSPGARHDGHVNAHRPPAGLRERV